VEEEEPLSSRQAPSLRVGGEGGGKTWTAVQPPVSAQTVQASPERDGRLGHGLVLSRSGAAGNRAEGGDLRPYPFTAPAESPAMR